jgi:hypothetical protein
MICKMMSAFPLQLQHNPAAEERHLQSDAAVAGLGRPPNVFHRADVLRSEEAAMASVAAPHSAQASPNPPFKSSFQWHFILCRFGCALAVCLVIAALVGALVHPGAHHVSISGNLALCVFLLLIFLWLCLLLVSLN